MKLTRIDLYNLALGNIKIGRKVGSLDDETTREFQLPQNYDVTLATLMSMHDWSFAAVPAKLARVAGSAVWRQMRTPWVYGWAYPADCVRMLEIGMVLLGEDGAAGADELYDFSQDWPWHVENGATGRIIRTYHDHACARYLSDAISVSDWPATFVAAFTWALASNITRANNADDGDADYRMKQAEYYIHQARIADANEMGAVAPRRGGWLEARQG